MECNKRTLDVNDDVIIANETNNINYKPSIDNDERYIYKIDVGTMRGYDAPVEPYNINGTLYNDSINTNEELIKEYGSRTPQVLEIIKNINKDYISILRSTLRNTRIHQPREEFENRMKIIHPSLQLV